jgi:hypothetical protein
MADINDVPQHTQLEHDGWSHTSATPEAELRKELEQAETQNGTPADPGLRPRETPEAPADPAPQSGKAPVDPAAPSKPAEKIDPKTPEGRKAQIQAEINALTREKHTHKAAAEQTKAERLAEERQLSALRAERDALQREIEAGKGGKPTTEAPAATERTPEPQEDDFPDDFREYIKAHAAWVREQAKLDAQEMISARDQASKQTAEEAARERQQQEHAAYRRELADKHAARVKAYEAEHPGFSELITSGSDLPMNEMMTEHILHSESGPALMQYLVEHPEECERIYALPGGPTLVELGKIEGKLSTPAKSGSGGGRKSVTNAQPPINPVGSSAAAADDSHEKDLANMDFSPEYVRLMNQRDREREKSRRL